MIGKFNMHANAIWISLQKGKNFGWPSGSADSEISCSMEDPVLSSTTGQQWHDAPHR